MKNSFITSLAGYFFEKGYFNFIGSETEVLNINNGIVSLIKEFNGTSVLLEIIDGDSLSLEQVGQSMETGAEFVKNINGNNAVVFKLFLFENGGDQEKLEIISQGQLDLPVEKKFLKTLSIDISKKTISKHFNVPSFDANITRTVKRFFSKGFDRNYITVEDINRFIEQRKKDYEIQIYANKSWLTYILIGLNILVWLIIRLLSFRSGQDYGNLLEPFGAKVNSLIMQGQYWRFITPMFLHANEIHLAVNCYSLFIVGSQVERLFGRRRFLLIYFIAGILGNIVSFGFSIRPAVGASGAIFGLIGAMLFFAIKRPSLLKSGFGANLITTIVINLGYGFMNSQIDNSAHLGGLAGGFLTTGAVYQTKENTSRDKLLKIISLIMVVAVSVAGLVYGFSNSNNKIVTKLETLQTLDAKGEWAQAEKLGEEIMNMEPSDKNIRTNVLFNLTKAEINQKKYQEGAVHAEQLLQVSPTDGHFLLGYIYFFQEQYENARDHLEKAKELQSPNTEVINQLLAEIKKVIK